MKSLGILLVAGVCGCSPSLSPRKEPDVLQVVKTAKTSPETTRAFIARNHESQSPRVQDLVTVARMQLAYRSADGKSFPEARKQFLAVVKKHRGTTARSSDWGSITDQAAYQAAVCLVAEGKHQAAEAELVQFMKERPLSPLVHAVHKRLIKMNPDGEESANQLLQIAISKQEAHIRFETSVCGPKAIAYLLDQGFVKGERQSYKQLAKLCGTTDDGTSISGMRKGLAAVGVDSFAYKLNRQDLGRAHLPALLLEGDHYVALLRVTPQEATVYDPRFSTNRSIPLPAEDNPDFYINAILFRSLELQP